MSDSAGYIPVTSLRGRPGAPPAIIPASGPYHNTAPDTDLDSWRADLWDRDYNGHRLRFNSTRVQRKSSIKYHQ